MTQCCHIPLTSGVSRNAHSTQKFNLYRPVIEDTKISHKHCFYPKNWWIFAIFSQILGKSTIEDSKISHNHSFYPKIVDFCYIFTNIGEIMVDYGGLLRFWWSKSTSFSGIPPLLATLVALTQPPFIHITTPSPPPTHLIWVLKITQGSTLWRKNINYNTFSP